MSQTKLERAVEHILDRPWGPPEWGVRSLAEALVEQAEEMAIFSARLELAQRYILRKHRSARDAIISTNNRIDRLRERLPLTLG